MCNTFRPIGRIQARDNAGGRGFKRIGRSCCPTIVSGPAFLHLGTSFGHSKNGRAKTFDGLFDHLLCYPRYNSTVDCFGPGHKELGIEYEGRVSGTKYARETLGCRSVRPQLVGTLSNLSCTGVGDDDFISLDSRLDAVRTTGSRLGRTTKLLRDRLVDTSGTEVVGPLARGLSGVFSRVRGGRGECGRVTILRAGCSASVVSRLGLDRGGSERGCGGFMERFIGCVVYASGGRNNILLITFGSRIIKRLPFFFSSSEGRGTVDSVFAAGITIAAGSAIHVVGVDGASAVCLPVLGRVASIGRPTSLSSAERQVECVFTIHRTIGHGPRE